jgi:hypothetical protein
MKSKFQAFIRWITNPHANPIITNYAKPIITNMLSYIIGKCKLTITNICSIITTVLSCIGKLWQASIGKLWQAISMNDYEKFSLLIQIIGFILVIISLCFLSQQTSAQVEGVKAQVEGVRSQVNGLRSSAYAVVMDKQIEIHKIFLEKPSLRPYFEGKKIQKSDIEYAQVQALADYHLDFFDFFWAQEENFLYSDKDGDAWRGWKTYIGQSFDRSPILCERIKEVKSWYENSFIEFIDQSIESVNNTKSNCNLKDFYKVSRKRV